MKKNYIIKEKNEILRVVFIEICGKLFT